jgi:hypothetical protein
MVSHALRSQAVIVVALALMGAVSAGMAQEPDRGCAGKMTEQLRRLNESCLGDLVKHLSGLPKGTARVWNENDKFYIKLTRADAGVRAEAVSKYNYPLMKEDTEVALKSFGWSPPDHEHGDFFRAFTPQELSDGSAVRELDRALRAYGMSTGEAISLTVSDQE